MGHTTQDGITHTLVFFSDVKPLFNIWIGNKMPLNTRLSKVMVAIDKELKKIFFIIKYVICCNNCFPRRSNRRFS